MFLVICKQYMEVIKIENMGHYRDDMMMPAADIFLLQVSVLFHIILAVRYAIYDFLNSYYFYLRISFTFTFFGEVFVIKHLNLNPCS